jgi:hypothetical protein
VQLFRGASESGEAVIGTLRHGKAVARNSLTDEPLSVAETRWHLPVAVLADPPAVGDRIVDSAAAVWTVIEVRHEAASGRWLCLSRDLATIHGLCDCIDIERAVWTKDAAGAARATWRPWRTGLRGRIQMYVAAASNAEGRDHLIATHHVLLVEPLAVDQDCRVVDSDSNTYRILARRPAQNIGEPDVLDVVADAVAEPEAEP